MIIVDYKSTTLRTNPSISVARKVLTILQHHYVETLGRAIVVNLPMILSFFYKGIAPFLDPVTRDKMRFNPDLFELVPREQLDADFGGDYEYDFEPESYWNQLIEYVIMARLITIPVSFFHHLRTTDGWAHGTIRHQQGMWHRSRWHAHNGNTLYADNPDSTYLYSQC